MSNFIDRWKTHKRVTTNVLKETVVMKNKSTATITTKNPHTHTNSKKKLQKSWDAVMHPNKNAIEKTDRANARHDFLWLRRKRRNYTYLDWDFWVEHDMIFFFCEKKW